MHDVVAHMQVPQGPDLFSARVALDFPRLLADRRAEDVRLRDKDPAGGIDDGAGGESPDRDDDFPGHRVPVDVLAVVAVDPVALDVLGKLLRPGPGGGDDGHPELILPVLGQVLREELEIPPVGNDFGRVDIVAGRDTNLPLRIVQHG